MSAQDKVQNYVRHEPGTSKMHVISRLKKDRSNYKHAHACGWSQNTYNNQAWKKVAKLRMRICMWLVESNLLATNLSFKLESHAELQMNHTLGLQPIARHFSTTISDPIEVVGSYFLSFNIFCDLCLLCNLILLVFFAPFINGRMEPAHLFISVFSVFGAFTLDNTMKIQDPSYSWYSSLSEIWCFSC